MKKHLIAAAFALMPLVGAAQELKSEEEKTLSVHDPRVLRVANVEESKAMLLAALEDRGGAARDIVALNAGASIYVSGLADTLADGVDQAFAAIGSGAGRARLDEFVAFTQRFSA